MTLAPPIAPLLAVLALLALPLVATNQFYLHLAITVLMWTLLGAAWNLLGGFAGQVSFGHAAFFGIGAYTTMILYLKLDLAPWYGMALGGLAGALPATASAAPGARDIFEATHRLFVRCRAEQQVQT